MAKRKYRRKKKKAVTAGKGFWSLFVILLTFAALVTINSFYPISASLPTWNSIRSEIESYWEDPMVPPEVVGQVDGTISVHFIDVGQGNCTLIQSNGHNLLIDAGENDQGDKVVAYLRQHGVEHLDYAVGTHPHSDHIGGMDIVLNQIPTDNIILPELKDSIVPTSRTYEDLLTAIQVNGVQVIPAAVGESYDLGGGIIRIIGPAAEFDDLNDVSVGVKFTYGQRRFIIGGDMEREAEKAVLRTGEDVQADVFSLDHHGSSTSNCEEYLDAIGAQYYVGQLGYQNQYGHPHRETLQRIQEREGTLYRTDECGTIVFTTDGTSLDVTTEK